MHRRLVGYRGFFAIICFEISANSSWDGFTSKVGKMLVFESSFYTVTYIALGLACGLLFFLTGYKRLAYSLMLTSTMTMIFPGAIHHIVETQIQSALVDWVIKYELAIRLAMIVGGTTFCLVFKIRYPSHQVPLQKN